ncbi:MAG TPA: 16S rRNA (guanine(966)-N(2))-methyltransferase RsmD [Anaerolineaceae bacterium]|jgi:16S rRNA (guanine(966)-N(2))-methyltransferase RsmD|nr:16S rRNA (guanine(966)-N(2))-methyltransferase RsmD [Longilinea sp.]HNR46449.1 16S rRNA (guanine(966)-N(2))-methyltransferase RsmD [Anaerolineaceae bacterium]HNS36333.1 16S rRNA (guanine(966)-N(2))-methyltransferase RsmD [Anaerolineaceae bacterium]HNZ12046.1 16S rRNA (guanine(966)-N(2))-methyltransferase RsmD [Anaerolineaceae bacterium]HOG78134.1 16S rRNA (guanine(966)-N(2))-methyltransferase RsmD [Anaerolineaceae bacterium]
MSTPRVIGGTARGIRLKDVPGDITRPITDRVKEALFNILGGDIIDASLLDLFGGTGAVGIEALSRGAAFVRINDLNRAAITTIRANLEATRLQSHAQVTQGDAFSLLQQAADRAFDYIYIAPPQYKGMWQRAIKLVDDHPNWLSDEAWVIVQIDPVEYEAMSLKNLNEFDQRRYGSTLLVFYERGNDEDDASNAELDL